jgi:hypothetical protein
MTHLQKLSPFVIAKLYKDNLVLVKDTQTEILEKIEEDVNILYLGENKKNIIILLSEENAQHISDDSFQFLTTILNACKLNIADVAIVNTNNQTINTHLMKSQLNPQVCIVFGNIMAKFLQQDDLKLHTPLTINNTIWLNTVEFSKLQDNSVNAKLEKSKLWICLKQIFQI